MELLARIAKDRIGVLIGKSGETKLEIEKAAQCTLHIDSETGEVNAKWLDDETGELDRRNVLVKNGQIVGIGYIPDEDASIYIKVVEHCALLDDDYNCMKCIKGY